jgi:hypothetical protein
MLDEALQGCGDVIMSPFMEVANLFLKYMLTNLLGLCHAKECRTGKGYG